MVLDAKFFMHESDRKALQALKAIPGFTQVFKAFMKGWNEKMMRVVNMSTNLRISEKQLPQYYHMLVPICEKLGIPVPELYLKLDVTPNAYTAGDTEPFIVITSGLLDTLPEELIPTVLAHECGHIVCHHCLYTTMGQVILSEAISMLGLSELAIMPIQVAFAYWMRCSELSADRVAAVCDGSADRVTELCMRFAGYPKALAGEANKEEFMNQARDYLQMVQDSAMSKTMEFLAFGQASHPMNAVRAYECARWAENQNFQTMCRYLSQPVRLESASGEEGKIPMAESSKQLLGKDYHQVYGLLMEQGFRNISVSGTAEKTPLLKDGQVVRIRVDGREGFEALEWYPADAEIILQYYREETPEEAAEAHAGQGRTPDSARHFLGRNYLEVMEAFRKAGFTNVHGDEYWKTKRGWLEKQHGVARVTVNGKCQFEKDEWFDLNTEVSISYFMFADQR